ncbi:MULTISPECIES: cutinase family protein [unclassified Nocardia]|uniref:cutinase family protein n=1 Tax=unclassified Nocardia TaxID=2637762 RepID=UPI001CE40333|nr:MULTISPECIES: cutinase family protein [unclassified Nocardia]
MSIHSTRRSLATTLVATGIAVASSAVAAPAVVQAAPAGCAATFNLFIPGTWETNPGADPTQPIGMLRPVAEAIQRENGPRADIYFTPYMARAFDNGHTYADSKQTALDNARTALRDNNTRCPSARYTITGYSQGADAAGDLASEIGNDRGPVPADSVLAVGLLADPGSGTKGEAVVGPRTDGNGIADPRPQGMGKLSGRVASICDPKDLYCSIQKGNNPLLGTLGSILSKTPSGTSDKDKDKEQVGGNTPLATALTSDFSKADLPGMASAVGELTSSLTAPGGAIDLSKIVGTATKLLNTISPLADLITTGAANAPATSQLAAAPTGTPENNASQILTKAGQSDLPSAVSAIGTITDTANKLINNGVRTVPANSPDATTLTTAANTLTSQVAPLTSAPTDTLGSATGILSVLKPNVLLNQALNVVTNVTALDLPGILNNLALLPQKVAAMDAQGAHKVAGDLNNQFQPLVKLVAAVDLRWISSILSIIPDPQGYTQIAALIVSILSNVDVIKLANIVGQIQEVAWSAIEKLVPPPGQAPDLAGAGAALTGLLPVGLDLASVAVNMLTGKAQKTSPQLLGKQANTAASTITRQAQNLDLNGLTGSLAQMANSSGANDLATLIGDGLSAASFFTSGAHTNYGSLVVDNSGRNAIQWLGDWLNLQIGRAV